MTTVYLLEWRQVSAKQVQRLIKDLSWQAGVDSQRINHTSDGRLLALQTWESSDAFEQYFSSCLSKALRRASLPDPFVQTWEISSGGQEIRSSDRRVVWQSGDDLTIRRRDD